MARIGRHRYRTVKEYMLRQYGNFNVFQLMRLLLSDSGSKQSIGQRLRFRADLSAAFPAREFAQIRLLPAVENERAADKDAGETAGEKADQEAGDETVEIVTSNFCVASVTGPMPETFTEWARELSALRSTAMADFLDIFNQRANVLRYQMKHALTLGLNDMPPADTEMAHCLASLMGLASPKLAAQVPLPARGWLGLAGLLANRRKHASTLVHVLGIALGTGVKLTEHIGAWLDIDERDRCALGRRNHRLGQTAVVGRRVWDQQARLRIDIGAIDYDALRRLLPPTPLQSAMSEGEAPRHDASGESGYAMLTGLVKLLVDRLADCEIVLNVSADSIPPTQLPQPARRRDFTSMRLGQTAWLAGAPEQRDPIRPVRYLIPASNSVGMA
ncbi:type VI secretion system baseplate subunit TssG [Trinickia dinghuensis]|uniref:Type VI secretion system baseplate subunit TssG n=1 Tax=Trinickia dinghuensis TaxID=2291023 RepID=A0A3D8JNY6_9BURK|nr:type VI secretion system baseplate subunit TssG [Trinickia dinghuensis]RDU94737.1 type VI secretion system baseplate subunit TssG [Trinickia dinghuensis]